MDCAHASDPEHQCCGKHEHGRSGPITAASDLLGSGRRVTLERMTEMAKDPIQDHCSCGDGCERTFDAAPQDHAKS